MFRFTGHTLKFHGLVLKLSRLDLQLRFLWLFDDHSILIFVLSKRLWHFDIYSLLIRQLAMNFVCGI